MTSRAPALPVRLSALLLVLTLSACGGSSGSDAAGGDGAGNPGNVVDQPDERTLALYGLRTHDALFFVAGPLSDELRLLLDEPDQACPETGSVDTDRAGELVTHRFSNCALRLVPGVVISGALVLRGTDLQSSDALVDMQFTGLQLLDDAVSVRIDGALARHGDGARVSLEGAADITLASVGATGEKVSVTALTLLLDRSRLSASRELDYLASLTLDQGLREFTATGEVQGGSAGCPLSGRWTFDVNDAEQIGVAGAEGGNLLLTAGGVSSTLACSELALLAASEKIAPPRPPQN